MRIERENIEMVVITIDSNDIRQALDYCSNGLKIVDLTAERDGRSGNYTGKITIKAYANPKYKVGIL